MTGFSLIELLVVVAIVVILAAVTVPATSSALRGASLNQAGQLVSDQLSVARQEAVSKSQDVEVRFYRMTNGLVSGWKGLRIVRIEQTPTGPVTNPVGRFVSLPDSVMISESSSLSPLMMNATAQSENMGSRGQLSYRAFRFRPNGGLEVGVGSNNFVTLVNMQDIGASPANFYTIQINPLSGKATVYRP